MLNVARRRSGGSAGLVLGAVLLVGLALLVIKWLFFTALILVVPFGAWWLLDRRRRPTTPGPPFPPPMPAPSFAGGRPFAPATPRAPWPAPSWPVPPGTHPAPTRERTRPPERTAVVVQPHHQPALRRAARGAVAGEGVHQHLVAEAFVVSDPEAQDRYAMRVDLVTDYGPETVGHLPGEQAQRYRTALPRTAHPGGPCPARITGGGPGRPYGVYLP